MLKATEVQHGNASVVVNEDERQSSATGSRIAEPMGRASDQSATTSVGMGATLGAVLGGSAGLLTGLAALAIPDLDPIVAAGWSLAAVIGAAVGAAVGGLLGLLTSAATSKVVDLRNRAKATGRKGSLATVQPDEMQPACDTAVLANLVTVDFKTRRAVYQLQNPAGSPT